MPEPPPRFATPRTAGRATHGPALAETAGRFGVALLPWQRLVADVGLEHDAGHLGYRDVVVAVPRQSGKTTLLLAVMVHRMLAAPGRRVAYMAQTRLAARGKLFDTLWPMVRRSPLGPLFTLTRATGAETLRAANGSILSILSADEAAGHGETFDLSVLDECWALGAAAEQAVRPAMVTRPNAQLVMASTAGTERSVFWRSKVDAGRTAATLGLPGVAFFEWSAPADADPGDPAVWRACMPALGHTVDEATVQADLAAMAPAEFRRAYLNQWPDESDAGWRTIDRDAWKASLL
ncbi:MAG: terminase large subunit domain-containing protein [Acidimicrobiia bacterium]